MNEESAMRSEVMRSARPAKSLCRLVAESSEICHPRSFVIPLKCDERIRIHLEGGEWVL